MKDSNHKIRYTKRNRRTKRIILICLAILACSGFILFHTVKTNASIAVKNDIGKAVVSAVNETKLQLTSIVAQKVSPSAAKSQTKPATLKPKAIQSTVKIKKTAYLTFDDGPSKDVTPQILNILNKYGIKASFFVIGTECYYYPEMLIKEKNDGNTICNHTYSHNYKAIYSNIPSFEKDVKKCDNAIKSVLGDSYSPKYIRFPGGGFGKKYFPYRNTLKREGYTPVNWNIDTGDSLGKNVPAAKLIENVKNQLKNVPKGRSVIVLMHDMTGKQTTVEALPSIIAYLKAQGYTFAKFD
ncbi:MAG TPA: polysaccharide deacetylase family protein [Clostridia bacterium]|nr:polysaccharide deacetylase family protein [Clostridia bacterium]